MKHKQHAIQVKKESGWDPESAPTFWINHASRLVMRHFEQSLRPLGFGMAYLPVAMALHEDGPCLQKDLAVRAHVEQATMAALLVRMERDDLIERSPHPTDRRASLISLTQEGRERLPEAQKLLQKGADQAVAGLSAAERATFIALLKRVVSNLDERAEDERA